MSFNPKELIIASILTLLSLVSSLFFWQNFHKILLNPLSIMTGSAELGWLLLFTFLGFLFYLTFVCLTTVLLPHFWLRFLVAGISVVTLPLVFYQMDLVYLIISFSLILLGLIHFVWKAQTEMDLHLKIRLSHIYAPVLSTLLLLLIIVMSVQTFSISQKANIDLKVKIPDAVFGQILQQFGSLSGLTGQNKEEGSGFFGSQVKGATDYDLQAILEGKAPLPLEVMSYFEKGELPPEVMSELQKQGVTKEMVQQALSEVTVDSQGFLKPKGNGVDNQGLGNSETGPGGSNLMSLFSSQLKTQVEDQINSFISPFKQYIPAVLAISVFLTLLTIKGILTSLVILLFSLLVLLLKLSKVVRVEKKEIEVERLVI